MPDVATKTRTEIVSLANDCALEVSQGQRFEFGENWTRFLSEVDEARISLAVASLREMLELDDLSGRRFLDIGCGSGLFSLAARRLGATVFSFDLDPQSVACTRELKRRYANDDDAWTITTGGVLDSAFVASLGKHDIVYSWGVLHHTGAMWQALENALSVCKSDGLLFIAIYNDEGGATRRWTAIKRMYNAMPKAGKSLLVCAVGAYFIAKGVIAHAARFKNPIAAVTKPAGRGMSWYRDLVDWVGGYPFEAARPEQIFDFCRARGFNLMRLKTDRGYGCNEFVFRRA